MSKHYAYNRAAELIAGARRLTAFTGAGISVESGVPPFRGQGGLWARYDPQIVEIGYFKAHPAKSWELIKQIFYDTLGSAQPNDAHRALAEWDATVITQNIDGLHQLAGSRRVWECHGNWRRLLCLKSGERFAAEEVNLRMLPPVCGNCGGMLKPDFVFFGEAIPEPARSQAFLAAEETDVMLVIGTTGQVMPACLVPWVARRAGAEVIEVNPQTSEFTGRVSTVFLQDTASLALNRLKEMLK